MPVNKKTTLKDIAEKLNITVATVSRAMSNHPDISQRIKDQVKLLAETLNYRPNSFALHLRKQRSGMIGIILPKIIHYHSSTILSGVILAAHDLKYQVMICESGSTPDEEKNNAWALLNAGVDGLLVSLSNNTFSETHFSDMQNEGIPIVFFDKVPNSFIASKVSTNDYTGAFIATEHLIEQGYKNIAHLKGQIGARNSEPRFRGYMDALQKHHLEANQAFVYECLYCTEEEGFDAAQKLLKKRVRPDSFFCVNDETAIGVLAAMRQMNISVPGEVGVVGFCNLKAGAYMNPSLSTVDQAGIEIGKKAAAVLIDMIEHKADPNCPDYKHTIIEPQLIIRESSRKQQPIIAGKRKALQKQ
jgi:LacI family transcriptional regulator